MSVFHDEVEIEDFRWDDAASAYVYICPCGDTFQITKVRTHARAIKRTHESEEERECASKENRMRKKSETMIMGD
jgi:hypothetical protein